MSTYRSSEERHPKISTVETDGLVEILKRTRAIRKRIFLPTMIVAAVVGFVGAAAHASGYWSVLGRSDDGSYYVTTFTTIIALLIPASPFLLVGGGLYLVTRAAMRRAWTEEFRARKVEGAWPEREAWLAETAKRFG